MNIFFSFSSSSTSSSVLLGLTGLSLLLISFTSSAGGISLGATRLVYMQDAKQVSLPVRNSTKDGVMLIQSWVDDAKGKKSGDFVVTPPLFTLKPSSENAVRVMYVGENAPTDREQLYFFNSKAIPAVDKNTQGKNTLQIAIQSEIKIFLRPNDLAMSAVDAPAALRCKVQGGNLVVTNPSPYYLTLVAPTVGGKKLDGGMVEPKGSLSLPTKGAAGEVRLQTINDFGAQTAPLICPAA